MALLPIAVVSDISRVLNAIRSSLDPNAVVERNYNVEAVRTAFLAFEAIRFDFRIQTGHRMMEFAEVEDDVLIKLIKSLEELRQNSEFHKLSHRVVYRAHLPSPKDRSFSLHPVLQNVKISLSDALKYFLISLEDVSDGISVSSSEKRSELTSAAIRKATPKKQTVGPVQFTIINEKLEIQHVNGLLDKDDLDATISAKQQLVESGAKIADQLSHSNCDKRLLETVTDLQERLASNKDIIRLGLSNINCELMLSHFQEELPTAVSAMLKAHIVGISMYVAQYPEWHRFSEQAATANFSPSDNLSVIEAVEKVITNLKLIPDSSDPEVPRTLEALRDLAKNPGRFGKRAAYAVWRSIENLAIKVFNYAADFIDQFAKKTSERLSTAASRLVVVGLVTAAVAGLTTLMPIAAGVPGSSWIATAVEAVKEQIVHLKLD